MTERTFFTPGTHYNAMNFIMKKEQQDKSTTNWLLLGKDENNNIVASGSIFDITFAHLLTIKNAEVVEINNKKEITVSYELFKLIKTYQHNLAQQVIHNKNLLNPVNDWQNFNVEKGNKITTIHGLLVLDAEEQPLNKNKVILNYYTTNKQNDCVFEYNSRKEELKVFDEKQNKFVSFDENLNDNKLLEHIKKYMNPNFTPKPFSKGVLNELEKFCQKDLTQEFKEELKEIIDKNHKQSISPIR